MVTLYAASRPSLRRPGVKNPPSAALRHNLDPISALALLNLMFGTEIQI
jgi:hypothetical protein